MPDVTIVPMRGRHVRGVLEIERQVYPRPWTRSLFLSELALRSSRAYFVAMRQRDLVGYGGVMLNGDEAHITTLAVHPAQQHGGIATRLLLQLSAEALRRNARSATLEVRTSNVRAQRLYGRFGYMPVGIRRNYYAETNEDAIIMTAPDIRAPEYVERLRDIARSVPGRTAVLEDPSW